jgi:hypothetical protein
MMNLGDLWYLLLFVMKWVFLGVVYFALFRVVRAVRREIGLRMAARDEVSTVAPAYLKIVRAGSDRSLEPGALIPLQSRTSLGTEPLNDVVLRDRHVSARHARLRWDGVGWWIEDLGSRNGTFVDDQPAPRNNERPVPVGANLRLGDTVLQLIE